MTEQYLSAKQLPAAIKEQHGYEICEATIRNWRRRIPLALPCTLNELREWFRLYIQAKRG